MTITDDEIVIDHTAYDGRFWSKVEFHGPDDCWLWLGTKSSTNSAYGRFTVGNRVTRPAHQISWELANNQPFPKGKNACHSCDNPSCVNPKHIWPGTQSENVLDCVRKGRSHSNRRNFCYRGHELTPETRAPAYANFQCIVCLREGSRRRAERYRIRKREKRNAAC